MCRVSPSFSYNLEVSEIINRFKDAIYGQKPSKYDIAHTELDSIEIIMILFLCNNKIDDVI